MAKLFAFFPLALLVVSVGACDGNKKLQRDQGRHARGELAKAIEQDVQESADGLPEGAKHLTKLFEGSTAPKTT